MAPELRTCCDLILSTVEIKRDKATQVQCNVATENRHLELLLSEHLFPADNSNVSQKGSGTFPDDNQQTQLGEHQES